jgi:hypothetical protein
VETHGYGQDGQGASPDGDHRLQRIQVCGGSMETRRWPDSKRCSGVGFKSRRTRDSLKGSEVRRGRIRQYGQAFRREPQSPRHRNQRNQLSNRHHGSRCSICVLK